jgi:hypothetical protein
MALANGPRAGGWASSGFLTWQCQSTIGYVAGAYATIGHDWMEGRHAAAQGPAALMRSFCGCLGQPIQFTWMMTTRSPRTSVR